jgi:hypothetical protein
MRRLPWLAILLAAVPVPLRAEPSDPATASLPVYEVADPDAPVVTAENLLASERFWPYQVALVEPWRPDGRPQPLQAGARGVLIRVEASGRPRIDFGRNGRHVVPLGVTDLLQGANRIRRGEERKLGPNFALAIGSKLVDPGGERLAPFPLPEALERPGFLCVFADPDAEGFAPLAAALAPLRERHGVLTIFFPQGQHSDARIRDRLRALGWTVPFAYDFLAEAYSRSLLPDATALPALLLQTNEGRLLFQGEWRAGIVPELASALDAAFGAASRTAVAPAR